MSRSARIAVVGAGWWSSTVHLPALAANRDAELVAVCDPSDSRGRAAAEAFGIPSTFTDVVEMLHAVQPDGVVVATPHSTHYSIVKQVLLAGSNVLVEKPLATTARDAWELVELAKGAGRLLAVGLTYQYSPTALKVREAVTERIGELRSINAEFSSKTLALFSGQTAGDTDDNPAVPHGSTYSDPATGGGQGHTQLNHLLSGALWAAGAQATEVSAFMAHHGLAVDLVDALSFRLTGGALGVASSTGTTPQGVPSRNCIRFHGTEGMLEWDMLRADAFLFSRGGSISRFENPEYLPSYPREIVSASFVDSLLNGTPTPAPAEAAAAGVALVEAAYESARTGVAHKVDVR